VDSKLLQTFQPFDSFRLESLVAVAKQASLKTIPVGRTVFSEGDAEQKTFYLVTGEIDLMQADRVVATLRGGTPDAKNPVAPVVPRLFSARARTECQLIVIDSDMLDILQTWDRTGVYEVKEIAPSKGARLEPISGDQDWMTTLLALRMVHLVPPANLQQLFMRVEQVPVTAGETIIRQGSPGDFFYVVVSGQCEVVRDTSLHPNGLRLAVLGPGESFGEESLISRTVRNANVVMVTDGLLLRLAQEDFETLLVKPLLHWVDFNEAKARTDAREYTWLDVRLPSEFAQTSFPGALNIPLFFLRLKAAELDRNRRYVVVCDNGLSAAAAAFLLIEYGIDAVALRGGMPVLMPELRPEADA